MPRQLSFIGISFAWLLVSCSPRDEVLTYTVDRRSFVREVTAEGFLEAEVVTMVTVPSSVRRAARIVWLCPDGAEVNRGDVIARFDRLEMEQRLEDGESDLAASALKRGKAQADGKSKAQAVVTRLEVAELELDLASRFEKSDDQIFSRNEIIESQIDAAQARVRRGHATELEGVQAGRTKRGLELLEIESRRAAFDVEEATEALEALELRAPHAGILTWNQDWRGEKAQIGDEVWSGNPLGSIPDLEVMQAEVFVLEADAGGVALGRPAEVRLDAAPGVSYPALVKRVDSVAQRPVRGSPVQYFGVTLQIDGLEIGAAKPGQRLQALLELERLDGVLVVPRQALFDSDGLQWVYVDTGRSFERRDVELGSLSAGLAVVEDGLEEGDIVALDEPSNLKRSATGG